jgi:hypothetical protein
MLPDAVPAPTWVTLAPVRWLSGVVGARPSNQARICSIPESPKNAGSGKPPRTGSFTTRPVYEPAVLSVMGGRGCLMPTGVMPLGIIRPGPAASAATGQGSVMKSSRKARTAGVSSR